MLTQRVPLLALLLMLLTLVVTACGQPEVDAARAQLCQDLRDFQVAVRDLTSVTPETTAEELQAARESVVEAYNAVELSADNVPEAQLDDLQAAYADLSEALGAIPGNASAVEALDTVQDELTAVNIAWEELLAEVQCSQ